MMEKALNAALAGMAAFMLCAPAGAKNAPKRREAPAARHAAPKAVPRKSTGAKRSIAAPPLPKPAPVTDAPGTTVKTPEDPDAAVPTVRFHDNPVLPKPAPAAPPEMPANTAAPGATDSAPNATDTPDPKAANPPGKGDRRVRARRNRRAAPPRPRPFRPVRRYPPRYRLPRARVPRYPYYVYTTRPKRRTRKVKVLAPVVKMNGTRVYR